MSSDAPAIAVHGVSKCYPIYDRPADRLKQLVLPRFMRRRAYYREFWALEDLTLEISRGETFGIIGRNGSGKSTLLQLICGTLTPTAGTIETNGRIGALLELGAGFNPEFTGAENVYLAATLYGLSAPEVDRRFDRIAAFAALGEFIDQPVKSYSSGMALRLAFAVIANIDADILVIDETLSVGDAYFVQKCMRFLREFMQNGTLVIVSHDTGAVVNLCSRALLLDRGMVKGTGKPKAIVEQYLAGLCGQDRPEGGPAETLSEDDEEARRQARLRPSESHPNDIEVFRFRPDVAGFGTGQARIVSAELLDAADQPLTWTLGDENVTLRIVSEVVEAIARPILGFVLKDRLGQILFADNTYLTYRHDPRPAEAGAELVASFTFRMPILPTGDYSFSVAVAEGTQDQHVQHHWLNDALIIRAHASAVCFGLFGVPMKKITMSARPGSGARGSGMRVPESLAEEVK
jgi:lipopolysaccharide transport system ATP-binding protein